MSKKYRIYQILFVVLAVLAVVAVPVLASGNGEDPSGAGDAQAGDSPGEAEMPAPFSDVDSVEEAVEAAMAVPGEWAYDPGSRFIYDDSADIPYPIQLDEEVWRSRLNAFQYYVLREQGTEYAFSNPMHENKESGIYYSRATGQPLFSSEDKYDSRTGWPSFTKPINPDAIVYVEDNTLFSPRIEVVDSLSGSHLGHVFPDGPAPTGQRYCINAASLIFVPDGEEPPALIQELQQLAAAE